MLPWFVLDFDLMKTIQDLGEDLHNFITDNQDSPIFWACLFLGLLLLFVAGMNSLNKNG